MDKSRSKLFQSKGLYLVCYLVEHLEITDLFLHYLEAEGLLLSDHVESILNEVTTSGKVLQFLEILVSRDVQRAGAIFMEALRFTNQWEIVTFLVHHVLTTTTV